MTLAPSLVSAFVLGWIALGLVILHIISSKAHPQWMSPPSWIRHQLWFVAGILMIRCVNLLAIWRSGEAVPGAMNLEGMIAWLAMGVMITSLTAWALMRTLPGHGWERVKYVADALRAQPQAAPLMIDPVEVGRAAGMQVVAPGEGAEAVARELSYRRFH